MKRRADVQAGDPFWYPVQWQAQNNCCSSRGACTTLRIAAATGVHRLWDLFRSIQGRVLFDACSGITEAVSKQSRTSIEQGVFVLPVTSPPHCHGIELFISCFFEKMAVATLFCKVAALRNWRH